MTITPELDAFARTLYVKIHGITAPLDGGFDGEIELRRKWFYDVGRVCLMALLPVSESVLDAVVAGPEWMYPGSRAEVSEQFAAAIRHILGETP